MQRFLILGVTLAVLQWTLLEAAAMEDAGWTLLSNDLEAFGSTRGWSICGDVRYDAERNQLVPSAGHGVLLSEGDGRDLRTKTHYRDCELELEFMIPARSNSGVKLSGAYELQILDSWGKKLLNGNSCGGIYPRVDYKPKYKKIDNGVPPRTNASRKPGQWQTLRISFRAARFGIDGKKTENARFDRVELNGVPIHQRQEVLAATGHAWRNAEPAEGPLLLQGDHGPIAFRRVRIRSERQGREHDTCDHVDN